VTQPPIKKGETMSTNDSIQRTAAVSIADQESVKKVLVDSVLGLWDVVNNLTRIKPERRDRYRVTIFGSARAKPGTAAYEETKRVSKGLAELGCDVITGGGPGLMQAANEGVNLGRSDAQDSLGIRVDLPFEQEVNPFVEMAFEHRTFFTRLHHFVLASDAFIVAPGGIGTVLETAMIWQLLQVKHLQETPLASPGDFNIPTCVANGDEAIAIIRNHHAEWLASQQSINQQSEARATSR